MIFKSCKNSNLSVAVLDFKNKNFPYLFIYCKIYCRCTIIICSFTE